MNGLLTPAAAPWFDMALYEPRRGDIVCLAELLPQVLAHYGLAGERDDLGAVCGEPEPCEAV
jgi:hypothetical protein